MGDVGGEGIMPRLGEPPRPPAASLAAADAGMLPASNRPSLTRIVDNSSRFRRAEGVLVRRMTSMSSLAEFTSSSRRGR
jgi:hypothetical protein